MKTIYLLIFLYLNCHSCASTATSPEYFYFSWSGHFSAPRPALDAARPDRHIRWFDDYPSARSDQEARLGIYLPRDYILVARYKEIHGTHRGEAASHQCLLSFCAWIGTSLLAGLPANDVASYRIQAADVWIEKSPFDTLPGLSLRAGLNIASARLSAAGSGQERSVSGTVPLPFAGIAIKKELFGNLSVFAEANYSRLEIKSAGAAFRDTSLGISARISDQVTISTGVRKNGVDVWYFRNGVVASLRIPQTTPFLSITVAY